VLFENFPPDYVIAICGVPCPFSRRITIYLPSVWFRRAPTGNSLTLSLPTPYLFFLHPSQPSTC